jgi:hypothetical protein
MSVARRLKARPLAAFAVMAAVSTTATIGFSTPPAAAICPPNAYAPGYPSNWALEVPQAGTCNGDSWYAGRLSDTATDGSCVAVVIADGGQVFSHATSCTSSGINYTYHDTRGNNAHYMRVCRYMTDCGIWVPNTSY